MLVSSKGTVPGRSIVYRRVTIAHPWQQEHRHIAVTFGRPNDSWRRLIRRPTARAWDWRRWLDRGDVATIRGTAVAGGVTELFVSPFLRLAYLAPGVLEGLSIRPRP